MRQMTERSRRRDAVEVEDELQGMAVQLVVSEGGRVGHMEEDVDHGGNSAPA